MILSQYKKYLIEQKAIKESLIKEKNSLSAKIVTINKQLELHTKARWILVEVALQTQNTFFDKIEFLVTSALQSVYPDRNIRFICKFERKRNKSECYLLVVEGDGEPFDPIFETGGGLVDTISMALRFVFCRIAEQKTRPILILDEPFKNADHFGMREQLSLFLREISTKLDCQVLLITHEPELIEVADKSWMAKHNGKWVELEEQ